MKKRLFVVLTVVIALAVVFSEVPAVAAEVPTGVNVTGGTTTPPIIKAKWEQDSTACLEDGDPLHETAGGQFLPPGTYNGTKAVQYWVIVTDPEGVGTVTTVEVDVYHPAGPPEMGSKKYQLILTKVDKELVGIPAFVAAWEAGLVTWNAAVFADEDEALEDIADELDKCTADVYMVQEDLSYHQPAGDYRVAADACDSGNVWAHEGGTELENLFTYVAVPGFEVDFNALDYGNATVCVEKMIAGDTVFDLPVAPAPDPNPATVRNIGNTDIRITIWQNDMSFGYSGNPPNIDWNVEYDARMGSDNLNKVLYDPEVEVTLPNKLPLCNTEELDFSIHIEKSGHGSHSGTMIVGCVEVPFGISTEPGIAVRKEVWDPEERQWVEEICALLDDIVTFKCTIHNDGCCNLTKILVTDILSDSLEYADNATINGVPWEPTIVGSNEFVWELTGWVLEPYCSIGIEFDALVVRWSAEPDVNTQTAEAWCEEAGIMVDDKDTAAVQPFCPGDADMDGDIDVFDWVRVERILIELAPPTCGADADMDGDIDDFDSVMVERILMKLEPNPC